jgi:menaquinol-cytochrome c reductase iron-sulfur subunit
MNEPARPQAAGDPDDRGRRRFLTGLLVGLGGVAAAVLAVPVIGALVWPHRRMDRYAWRAVGRFEEFVPGATVKVTYLDTAPLPWAGYAAETAAWVRRTEEDQLEAFSVYCTHVGCPVRWEEGAQLFMCPCHGGAFRPDGSVASGPPPAPLPRYPIRIRNGVVEVQATPIPLAG